jgi:choloylglycine hydrolase
MLMAAGLLLPAHIVRACTAFCQESGDIVLAAKNYDWHLDQGFLIVNKKGIMRRAMLLDFSDTPAVWTSKYGSVTFNQYGREMPCGGMNEAGLVAECLMLPGTQPPPPDDRPAVTAWVQYQLDNCRSVAGVVATDSHIRISPDLPMPLHYFVCDREGNAAVVEFLDGKLVCHTGDALPHKLITNDTCAASLAYLRQHTGFGGDRPIRQGSHDSRDRFVIAAERMKNCRADTLEDAIRYAFGTLVAADQDGATMWSIVYDPVNLKIHYKTNRCIETRSVKMTGLDFSARTPVRMLSINAPHIGAVNGHFMDYDADLNRCMLFFNARHTPGIDQMPEAAIEALARYPETTFAQ